MTKKELAQQVAGKTGMPIYDVMAVLEQSFITITKTVAAGEGCYFRGFGTFIAKLRQQKTGRDITRGKAIIVPAHNIASFKPSPEFNNEVKKLKA